MIDAAHILIAVPTILEWDPLIRELDARPDPEGRFFVTPQGAALVRTGIGSKRTATVLRPCLESGKYRHIVSAGCAGSLRISAGPGTVLVPRAAINPCGENSPLLLPDLNDRGRPVFGDHILSVGRPAGQDAKAALAARFPAALGVDMESFRVGRLAEEYGITASVVRVVVDSLGERIPRFSGRSGWGDRLLGFRYRIRAGRYCARIGRLLGEWLSSPVFRD